MINFIVDCVFIDTIRPLRRRIDWQSDIIFQICPVDMLHRLLFT